MDCHKQVKLPKVGHVWLKVEKIRFEPCSDISFQTLLCGTCHQSLKWLTAFVPLANSQLPIVTLAVYLNNKFVWFIIFQK